MGSTVDEDKDDGGDNRIYRSFDECMSYKMPAMIATFCLIRVTFRPVFKTSSTSSSSEAIFEFTRTMFSYLLFSHQIQPSQYILWRINNSTSTWGSTITTAAAEQEEVP